MSWLPKRSVVVPVDFSEQSLKTVDMALGLVEDTSQVHVVHVLPCAGSWALKRGTLLTCRHSAFVPREGPILSIPGAQPGGVRLPASAAAERE